MLIAAAERGFAMAEGIEIELHKEVSWANIRDKVNVGLLDGAHMLGPLAIASSLGLGHVRVPLVVPFAQPQRQRHHHREIRLMPPWVRRAATSPPPLERRRRWARW